MIIPANTSGGLQNWGGGRGTVIVRGVFGGAAVTFMYCEKKSANNSADWSTVDDANGPISITAQKVRNIELGGPAFIRPVVTGGDGTTAIEVIFLGSIGTPAGKPV